jgi:hypothetical protein
MKTLLVHDDGALSKLLIGHLGDERVNVRPVDAETVGRSEFFGLCLSADAVMYVSTGWDNATAARDNDWLDVFVDAFQGSAKRLLYLSEAAPHPWRATAERRLIGAAPSGVHSVIVKQSLVHGWGASRLLGKLLTHAENSGESLYVDDGQARTSTVHVSDLISLVRIALVHGPEGRTYAAASDEVVTWLDVAHAVAATTRGRCEVRSVTAAEASAEGLDGVTMGLTSVVRDRTALRRLGWTACGPELVTDL